MGFFKSLKKVFNPGGAILSSYIGDGKDYRDPFEYMMKGGEQAKKNQQAQLDAQAAQRQGMAKAPYTPAPGGVTSYPSLRLGGSTGGYNYAQNPFAQKPPTSPPPMSFGGGGGGAGMTASGPQQMQAPPSLPTSSSHMGRMFGGLMNQLQAQQPTGSMQGAGAPPPQGQPTMPDQTQALISALRGRSRGGLM